MLFSDSFSWNILSESLNLFELTKYTFKSRFEFPSKNVRKVLFNYIAFTKSYIKSDMHATGLLDKPLDQF